MLQHKSKTTSIAAAHPHPWAAKVPRVIYPSAADDKKTAYSAAMKPFGALNQLENDHVLPLIYYYRSFTYRGTAPPEGARHALERASQLAVFDKSLLMDVAMMQAYEGNVRLAAYTLGPVAANPHGGSGAEAASALIEALLKAEDGKPFNSRPVVTLSTDEDADGDDDDD